ncbi:hypothetical protein AOLI_G00036840 [Acnodon oligacanthus]
MGKSKVGKSAIVSWFLNGRSEEQYTPTIEDFHRKLYSIRGDVYQLDILDTSGNVATLSSFINGPGQSTAHPEEELDRLTKKMLYDMNHPPSEEYFG